MEKHFPIHLLGVSKIYRTTFSLDLRKPCCKLAKACLLIKYWFCYREKILIRPHGSNSQAVRFYCLPKIHKNNTPMHPIVSACGTATYNTAKFISKILQNSCFKTSSFVMDSTDFFQKVRHLSINPEEDTLVSFNFSALFTSIPVSVALQISTCSSFTNVCKTLQKNLSSFWNSLSPTAFSASIRNSINNYRVQPHVYLSFLSLQISTRSTLNP